MSDMRLLVIEDDSEAAGYLVKAFREQGHMADHAADGIDGYARAAEGDYDVLIVDRMLPKLDGLSLISSLRAQKNETPVLILSALGLEKSTSYGQEIKIKDNSPILATVKKAALGFVQELIDKTVADAQAEVKWKSVINDAIIRDMKKLYRDTFERHARELVAARAKESAEADVEKFFAGVVEGG